jgi:molybdopterin molybdotransferase
MNNESDLITVDQTIALIDAAPVSPRIVRMKLHDAQGLRLAKDILADRDYPPFDKSLMDGFAVRCADVKTSPVELNVIGEIAAGGSADFSVGSKQTAAIMTGAPLPPGADGVVPVEQTQRLSPSSVRILHADDPSRFVTHRGADCAAGTAVLRRGMKLESAQLAVAASSGAADVDVFAKPQAAVLSTGDELVAIDVMPGASQIRNSNNIMLVSLLRKLGCDVTDLGTARDDVATIRKAIERGLQFDALFVTGGMSMGEYDFAPKVLLELGVELKITKLRIKPGKPFVFGQKGEKSFVFGLPGNPVSGFVCALRLCSRLLARMSGGIAEQNWIFTKLESPLEKNGSREFYQPAIWRGASVQPLKWKGSADIYTLAQANCLILRGENERAMSAGEVVKLLEIPS